MILADETEAGTAATQPCEGLARWAHRDDERRREDNVLVPLRTFIGWDPDALNIPARRAEYSLTESALSPFRAEPTKVSANSTFSIETGYTRQFSRRLKRRSRRRSISASFRSMVTWNPPMSPCAIVMAIPLARAGRFLSLAGDSP